MGSLIQRIEDAEVVTVGRLYDVPAVMNWEVDEAWPIIGPLHDDAELIGIDAQHWHYDWRFIPIDVLHAYGDRYMAKIHYHNAADAVMRIQRRCRRATPEFPAEFRARWSDEILPVRWMAGLEEKYANRRACNMVCPHRGFSLNGHSVKDGAIVCPGHGLKWRVEDGKLVRRASIDQPTTVPAAKVGA